MASSPVSVGLPAPGSHRRQRRGSRIALYAVLIAGAFVALLPFLYMLANSLKTYGETVTRTAAFPFRAEFWPKVPQWVNYQTAWSEANLSRYFLNSVVIASVTVSGIIVVSSLSAFAFSKLKFAGRDSIFTVLLATLMIPETVLLIPNFLIVSTLGWIDTLWALTVPFMGSAFFIFLLRQFFNQVPDTLLESAKIDGDTHLGSLLRIVMPLSRAPLFTVGFLSFTQAWNALQWPLVVTRSATWRPISVGLITFLQEAAAMIHLRLAGSTIALAPVLAIYIIAQRQITEAVARTGLKG
jgi:ABC-type glycerol-3-phosphate transport system permease component